MWAHTSHHQFLSILPQRFPGRRPRRCRCSGANSPGPLNEYAGRAVGRSLRSRAVRFQPACSTAMGGSWPACACVVPLAHVFAAPGRWRPSVDVVLHVVAARSSPRRRRAPRDLPRPRRGCVVRPAVTIALAWFDAALPGRLAPPLVVGRSTARRDRSCSVIRITATFRRSAQNPDTVVKRRRSRSRRRCRSTPAREIDRAREAWPPSRPRRGSCEEALRHGSTVLHVADRDTL